MSRTTQCMLSALPTELLDSLMSQMQAADLCALSLLGCRLLHSLAKDAKLWRKLWQANFGPISQRQEHAAVGVGSFKALYALAASEAKQQASSPWRKAFSAELNACIELMVPKCESCSCVLLLDGSGSVGSDEFAVMCEFVVQTTRTLKARCTDFKVGVVQFSNEVREEAPLAAVDDLDAFASTMQQMVRMNGGTNICAALQRAGQLLKKGAAPDARRLVLLLTDGRVDSHQATEAASMVERLADEQANVAVHAFGVGRGVDEPELIRILEGACGGGTEGAALAADRYMPLFVRDEVPW